MTTKHVIGLLFAVPALVAGCVSPDELEGAAAAPAVPSPDAPRAIMPTLRFLGPATLSTAPVDHAARRPPTVDGEAPAADPELEALARGDDNRFGVMYVDFEQAAEYVAIYDAVAVHELAAHLVRRGLDQGSKGDEDPLEVVQGWSNGVDNRQSFADWSLTHSTLRRVGQVGSGCTGALFGNRLVLTAAHCIFTDDGSYLQSNTFKARNNGGVLPYGTVTSQGAVYPMAFKNDGCHTEAGYTKNCVKNDWAILVLPPNPWANSPNGPPGWFGFTWSHDTTVATWDVRNIGYPSCSATASMLPADCAWNTAYGDLSCADAAPSFSSPDNRWPLYGDNGKMMTGCDTSVGHSGGPIYTYSPGTNGPYLIGNTVWNECGAASCKADTQYASAGIRINQTLFGYMLNLRATYP